MFSSAGFQAIKGTAKNDTSGQVRCIYDILIPEKVTAAFNILYYTPLHSK